MKVNICKNIFENKEIIFIYKTDLKHLLDKMISDIIYFLRIFFKVVCVVQNSHVRNDYVTHYIPLT